MREWIDVTIKAPPQPLLSLTEVAKLIGVTGRTVQRWVADGTFPPPTRVGSGLTRWTNVSIAIWLAWQSQRPRSEAGGDTEGGCDDRGTTRGDKRPAGD